MDGAKPNRLSAHIGRGWSSDRYRRFDVATGDTLAPIKPAYRNSVIAAGRDKAEERKRKEKDRDSRYAPDRRSFGFFLSVISRFFIF